MNFLAHIYLSANDDQITIGNFIADSIKGNEYTHLPENVQKGIVLHRAIDTFTDAHPIFRKSTKRLHPNYSHYSGVIVDVYYDHFLAKNWSVYSDTPLSVFVDDFYTLLENNYGILPPRIRRMMPYMIEDNWLLNYANLEGISGVLRGLNQRTKNRSKMDLAIVELKEHYTEFENEFTEFFEELEVYANKKYVELIQK